VKCPSGAQAHFYTQKVGNRWWLCDPAGNGFFLKGVYDIGPDVNSAQTTFIQNKYATGPALSWNLNWALEQARRIQLWGFNTVADYAQTWLWPVSTDGNWNGLTSDNTIPVKLPFGVSLNVTNYAFRNGNNCGISSAIKDLKGGINSSVTTVYYNFGDYFDPNFQTCAHNQISTGTYGNGLWVAYYMTPKYNSYLAYVTIDESDQLGPLDQGPNFPTVDPTNTGLVGAGPSAAQHPSWIALVTAPTQTANSQWGVSYSDTAVYTKKELSNWLAARYSNSIAALNTAWGSNYTTFGASGAGWGAGTGVLDEDGTCPSRGTSPCWVGDPITLAGETAAMRGDMSTFLVHYLDQYFSVVTGQVRAFVPGVLLQSQSGGWGALPRKEVLTETAKYIDLPIIGTSPPWICVNCTDVQARIDFTTQYLGDHPYINWAGFYSLPDSAESAFATANPAFVTQATRGIGYSNMVTAFANAKDTATGSYHVVGFDWWGLYDMDSQHANWGLLTPHDNPYDGKSATVVGNGKDQWGYPTGGEAANYTDFIDAVITANSNVYSSMAP
jgi:hypothetical protein